MESIIVLSHELLSKILIKFIMHLKVGFIPRYLAIHVVEDKERELRINELRYDGTDDQHSITASNLDKVANDGKIWVVSKGDGLLVDHESKDAKHGGTAVVELDGTLGELGLLIKVIPAEVDVSVAEVANVLVSSFRHITHEADLQQPDEGDDLTLALEGNGVGANEGGNAVGVTVKGITGVVDVSRKVEPSASHDLAQKGKLGDASVLDLDVAEAVEALLGDITGEHAEGVEEPKRGLGAKLVLESADGQGSLGHGGRGKSGGRADEGGDDG
jgi:hypothetical protein